MNSGTDRARPAGTCRKGVYHDHFTVPETDPSSVMTFRSIISIVVFPLVLILAACGGEQAPEAADEAAPEDEMTTEAQTSTETTEPEAVRLNINTATEAEMLSIPEVGNRMVHEFEEYRPYSSIEQFRLEIGKYVDEAQVSALEQYIYVPVNPNESDAATMQQIPGIGAEQAEALISGRPYASTDAFIEALREHISDEDVDVAKRYVSGM